MGVGLSLTLLPPTGCLARPPPEFLCLVSLYLVPCLVDVPGSSAFFSFTGVGNTVFLGEKKGVVENQEL